MANIFTDTMFEMIDWLIGWILKKGNPRFAFLYLYKWEKIDGGNDEIIFEWRKWYDWFERLLIIIDDHPPLPTDFHSNLFFQKMKWKEKKIDTNNFFFWMTMILSTTIIYTQTHTPIEVQWWWYGSR